MLSERYLGSNPFLYGRDLLKRLQIKSHYVDEYKVMDFLGYEVEKIHPSKYPEFAGNVFTTDTAPFQRAPSVSPDNDWTHWNDNGETLYLIGKAIGDGLVRMIPSP